MPEAGIYGEPIISDMKEAFYMSICWSSVCFDMKIGIIMSIINRSLILAARAEHRFQP